MPNHTPQLALRAVRWGNGLEQEAKFKDKGWVVDEDNLADYVGKPIFTSLSEPKDNTAVGVEKI